MSKTVYTPNERLEALAIFKDEGLAEAWRQTGIPKPTLAGWAQAAGIRTDGPAKTAAATEAAQAKAVRLREELRLALLEKAVDLLERMDAEHVDFKGKDAHAVTYPIAPAGAVQNYATSVGILIDKYRLEMGEVTGRTESQTVTGGMNDHERQTLRDILDRATAESARVSEGSDPVGVGPEVRQ